MTTSQNSIANPIETSSDWLLKIPDLSQQQSILVSPGGTGTVTSYSLVYDVYFPSGGSTEWIPFLQTDLTNSNDGDIFGSASSASYGIGIGGNYRGTAKLDAWNRVGVTIEKNSNGTVSMNKYVNGDYIATQQISSNPGRFAIDLSKGFLIFSDEDGDTSPGYLSNFLFLQKVLTKAEMSYLGAAKASGILPDVMKQAAEQTGALEVRFSEGSAAPAIGTGTITAKGTTLEFTTPAKANVLGIGETAPVDPSAVAKTAMIKDMMVTPDAANVTIDLSKYFSGEKLTFTVQNSENKVVNAVLAEGNKLTLDFAELGHSDIRVTATDAAGKSMADDFRVRVAGPNAYTIAVFPDTQDYTSNDGIKHLFGDMTQWLVDNRQSHNIVFMSHVGDITQNNQSSEWDIAEAALRKLDGKLPYALLPGNHDQGSSGNAANHSSDQLDSRFSAAKQAATNAGTFGGAYDQEQAAAQHLHRA